MNDNTDKGLTPDKSGYQVPQVMYGYPAPENNNVEIDLVELLTRLASQYKLIIAITLLGTLLSVAVALYLPNIYRQEVIVSMPFESDIAQLNANGYTRFTTEEIFKRYYNELRTTGKLEIYLRELGYLTELYPDSTNQENTLIAEFNKTFTIEILEPKPTEKGGIVTEPIMLAVRVDHEKEAVIAKLLNDYVGYAEKMLIKSLTLQQKILIESELKTITRDISLMRSAAKLARESEIKRLEEKNKKDISSLNNKIEALLLKSEADKIHEIVAMDSAYKIAKKLRLKKPTSIGDIGKNFLEGSNTTAITLTDRQELPLYLMGTDYLDAKREELKERIENIPFVSDYTSLKEQIRLIENDALLTSLKNRVADDPYIEELPALFARKNKLENISLVFDVVKTFKIEKNAKVTGEKIKPKRAMIVIGGVLFSSFLALFIGIVNSLLIKKKESY